MRRILDFHPDSEIEVVSRIVAHVHHAIDSHFPDVRPASGKFTKTVFSEGGEDTAIIRSGEMPRADTEGASTEESAYVSSPLEDGNDKQLDPTDQAFSQAPTDRMDSQHDLEFSQVEKLETKKSRPETKSVLRRILLIIFCALIFASLAVMWLEEILVLTK